MTEREEQALIVLNTLYNNPLLSDIHRQALEVGIKAIKALSSSENPKIGQWKRISRDMYVQHAMAYYECSECGKKMIGTHNYCPNCGAKMSEIPTGQIVANGELYPGEFDDPLAEEGSDKE